MQNLVFGMWSKREQSFTSPRVGYCPATCQRGDMELRPKGKGLPAKSAKTMTPPRWPFWPQGGVSVSLHPEAHSGWVGMVNDR
jgi:hypothetical protein